MLAGLMNIFLNFYFVCKRKKCFNLLMWPSTQGEGISKQALCSLEESLM